MAVKCYLCESSICLSVAQESSLRNSHDTFYCPVGHPQAFLGESWRDKALRLEKALDVERRRADMWMKNYRDVSEANRVCPWPECEWQTYAHSSRIVGQILRHLSRTHGLDTEIPRRLKVVA